MALDRNNPEVLELIEEVTAQATSALSAKNKELLAELRNAKAKAKGSEIDPEDHARLQSEVEELSGKLSKAEKTAKAEVDRLAKSLSEKDGALSGLLIDSGISDALAKAGVAPHYVTPLKAMFKTQAALKAEGGAYQALIGDKPLAEAISGYLGGDEGKHFVSAPANSGGGATGGAQKGSGKSFSVMTTEERTELYRRDPVAYQAAKNAG